ncbi:MAG: hypothetical protein U1D30_03495 [Planctomycetota bacterium]
MSDPDHESRTAADDSQASEPVPGNINVVSSWMESSQVRAKAARVLVLLAGILIPQAILHGPSLIGQKLLLPLDILAYKKTYLPRTRDLENYRPENFVLSDIIESIEFRRRFAVSEVRQGRLPLWNPLNYCGAPFIGANNTAVFSPFRLPDYLFPGPETIAWVQLLKALVAGIGAYLFFRHVLEVGFWSAALGAWCLPLTGFQVFWQGYPPSAVTVWLPWLLLATDAAVRKPWGWGGPGLAVVTSLLLVSGHVATAGQVLLASGFYYLWVLGDEYGVARLFSKRGLAALAVPVIGWLLGFMIAAPQNLPTLEYMRMSHRVSQRGEGEEKLPSIGFESVRQMLMPHYFGSSQRETVYTARNGNQLEGAASAYPGLIVALFLAPLGWVSRRHLSINLLWAGLGVFAFAYVLQLPFLTQVFETVPLRFLKGNRFVFVTTWCILCMAVVGFDVLRTMKLEWRMWYLVVAFIVAGLALQAGESAIRVPMLLRAQPEVPPTAASWYFRMYAGNFILCAGISMMWFMLGVRDFRRPIVLAGIAFFAVGEMVFNGFGVNPQVDPRLYYPRLPILERLAASPPGRVCGVECLPANLNQSHGLADIRGYDGADPQLLVDLLDRCWDEQALAANPKAFRPRYAVTQRFLPRKSPILDMLGLRYLVHRGAPPPDARPFLVDFDYWVEEIPTALPRAFVPAFVEVVPETYKVPELLSVPSFNPREVAYVCDDTEVSGQPVRGQVTIAEELPNRVVLKANMQTAGLVVLADLWFPGWRARIDGKEIPVLRANHALRGIPVPAGESVIEVFYEPDSFWLGVRYFIAGILFLLLWLAAAFHWRSVT